MDSFVLYLFESQYSQNVNLAGKVPNIFGELFRANLRD